MTFTIVDKVNGLEERMRTLVRRIEKEELRNKQLIIMFKMILEKVHNAHRSKKREVKIRDIVGFMELLVNKNLEPEEVNECEDLISNMIKQNR